MSHKAQKQFFESVKTAYPNMFENVRVCDCGSLDVNGSLKEMFTGCDYTGVDIVAGRNVDVVSKVHKLDIGEFETVVSGEMLEHSQYYKEDLTKMTEILKSKGLLAISAAGKDRPEHGTTKTGGVIWGTRDDYYRNIEVMDFNHILEYFETYEINYNPVAKDIYFWGIKK